MHMAFSDSEPAGLRRGSRRIAIGVAVSLAVHALILLGYRHTPFEVTESAPLASTVISVTLAPPPPPPPPKSVVALPAPARPSASARATAPATAPAAPRTVRPAPPQAVIAVPESTRAAPEPFVVQQDEMAEPATKFDMDAARQVARANAHLRDPSKEGTALAQFAEPALQTESALARGIREAKRPNCKDGLPGGLLAPLYLLMDKKDSGCKW